ncbi:GSCOCG00006484001-RA-CDS [Cotesia congregata]|nr:GSCOCG00006484001-RA-CDS [Cotesia congregata]
MASDNEASCVSDPNFAVICSFLECFGKSCGIEYPDIKTLQKMIEDTHEETQFDSNQRFKNDVNKQPASELRLEPLGRDKTGLAYWFQLDDDCNIRVYREDIDEESWELVATDREGVVKLINTLTAGEAGSLLTNEDSNSLEVSEKPIIDTGQAATSSPSAEQEPPVENGNASDSNAKSQVNVNDDENDSEGDDEEDEEDDDDDDDDEEDEDEEEEEGEGEEEEEEEEEEEDEELSNDASTQNTEEDGSQDVPPVNSNLKPVSNKITQPVNDNPVNAKRKPATVSEKDVPKDKPSVIKNPIEVTPLKSIETPVITSPLKLVPPPEPKHFTADLTTSVTISAVKPPPSLIEDSKARELAPSIKAHEKLPSKSSLPYSALEVTLNHGKFPLKPIDKLAANLVRMQSEKLEKPSASKLLEKIAENLARSSSSHPTNVMSNDDDKNKFPSDFISRLNVQEKHPIVGSSRSLRGGIDLSTSREWDNSIDHQQQHQQQHKQQRPVDFSGMDLSSRKQSKPIVEPLPSGYRAQEFHQYREMDLSTRKSKPDLAGPAYDSLLRNHSMIADLSKRQMPFVGYDMPSVAYHNPPVVRLPSKEEHRLPSYTILPDPSRLASMRSGAVKRALEIDETQQDMLKRLRADLSMGAMRGPIDKKAPLGMGLRREDIVGPAIEEPLMMVHGEGSGSDCDAGNQEVGDAIEEPVVFFYGEGAGRDCDTGNPGDESSDGGSKDSSGSQSKNGQGCSEVSAGISQSKLNNDNERDVAGVSNCPETSTSTSKPLELNNDCQLDPVTSNCQFESSESPKGKFKPTLGVQVIVKSPGCSAKRTSRWDVGRPDDKLECDSSISNEDNISEEPVVNDTGYQSNDVKSCGFKLETETISSTTNQSVESMSTDCNLPVVVPGNNLPVNETREEKMDMDVEKNCEGEDESPRFFFGPNCVSYTPSPGKRDQATSSSVKNDDKFVDNNNVKNMADSVIQPVSSSVNKPESSTEAEVCSTSDKIEKPEEVDSSVGGTLGEGTGESMDVSLEESSRSEDKIVDSNTEEVMNVDQVESSTDEKVLEPEDKVESSGESSRKIEADVEPEESSCIEEVDKLETKEATVESTIPELVEESPSAAAAVESSVPESSELEQSVETVESTVPEVLVKDDQVPVESSITESESSIPESSNVSMQSEEPSMVESTVSSDKDLENIRDIEKTNDSNDAFNYNVSEDQSMYGDQDSNDPMVIDEKDDLIESKNPGTESALNEENKDTEVDSSEVVEPSTSACPEIQDDIDFVSEKSEALEPGIELSKAQYEDVLKDLGDEQSEGKDCEAADSTTSKDASEFSESAETKSLLMSQTSLVANYGSDDSNDAGSDDVFVEKDKEVGKGEESKVTVPVEDKKDLVDTEETGLGSAEGVEELETEGKAEEGLVEGKELVEVEADKEGEDKEGSQAAEVTHEVLDDKKEAAESLELEDSKEAEDLVDEKIEGENSGVEEVKFVESVDLSVHEKESQVEENLAGEEKSELIKDLGAEIETVDLEVQEVKSQAAEAQEIESQAAEVQEVENRAAEVQEIKSQAAEEAIVESKASDSGENLAAPEIKSNESVEDPIVQEVKVVEPKESAVDDKIIEPEEGLASEKIQRIKPVEDVAEEIKTVEPVEDLAEEIKPVELVENLVSEEIKPIEPVENLTEEIKPVEDLIAEEIKSKDSVGPEVCLIEPEKDLKVKLNETVESCSSKAIKLNELVKENLPVEEITVNQITDLSVKESKLIDTQEPELIKLNLEKEIKTVEVEKDSTDLIPEAKSSLETQIEAEPLEIIEKESVKSIDTKESPAVTESIVEQVTNDLENTQESSSKKITLESEEKAIDSPACLTVGEKSLEPEIITNEPKDQPLDTLSVPENKAACKPIEEITVAEESISSDFSRVNSNKDPEGENKEDEEPIVQVCKRARTEPELTEIVLTKSPTTENVINENKVSSDTLLTQQASESTPVITNADNDYNKNLDDKKAANALDKVSPDLYIKDKASPEIIDLDKNLGADLKDSFDESVCKSSLVAPEDEKKEANKRAHIPVVNENPAPLKLRPRADLLREDSTFYNDMNASPDRKKDKVPEIQPVCNNIEEDDEIIEVPVENTAAVKLIDLTAPDVKLGYEDSDDSMGIDNECAFEPTEIDPLATTEDDVAKQIELDDLAVRVEPVNEVNKYEGWKLDSTETITLTPLKASRKRRNSNHESNSEDKAGKDVEEEETGGKRMRLRGKRTPDVALRKSVENSRIETVSSDDEAEEKNKEEEEESNEVTIVEVAKPKTFAKTKGRKKRGFKNKRKVIPPKKKVEVEKEVDQDIIEVPVENKVEEKKLEENNSKKKRKKKRMLLGLEIGIDIKPDAQPADGSDAPVRQSRRIAQIKIKEEADRRRIEEETLDPIKPKKIGGVVDKKKRKKKAESEEEVVVVKEIEKESKKKKKKRKKKKKKESKFNEAKPWQSSSGSSTEDENENEEEEDDIEEDIESEGSFLFKSDHEFSPESDLEKDEELEPMRRARTARKPDSDVEEADDEYACQKCGKADHPEWILLCDTCDKGWHCSCLRPALMLIPEGDWFCPPCQHKLLVNKLRESLKNYDQLAKRHQNEILRKKRLAFVGISLDNVLQKDGHRSHRVRQPREDDEDDESDEEDDNRDRDHRRGPSSSSSSSSGSSSESESSSEESEPVYQLRERRCVNTSYKFNEYDDMINAAIQDEVEAVQGAGNQGRGKDISTIVNAEKEEGKEAFSKKNDDDDEEEDDKQSDKDSDKDYTVDKEEEEEEDAEEKRKAAARKAAAKKKHRKLNSLDISSEDDPESDEDFKGSDSDEEEDYEDQMESSDDSSFTASRRRGGKKNHRPVRRSTRAARKTRYDEDFINDDSDDSDRPKRKRSKSTWEEESESEESDNSWRSRKKKSKASSFAKLKALSKSKAKKKKKRKRIIEPENKSEEENNENEGGNEEENGNDDGGEKEEVGKKEGEEVKEKEEKKEVTEVVKPQVTSEYPVQEQVQQPAVMENELVEKKEKKRQKKSGIRRKIIYGGLPDDRPQEEEEPLGRRTRGRKINYQVDIIMSDSEEVSFFGLGLRLRVLKKALRKTEESEDEFMVHDGEDNHNNDDKDSDSGDIYSPKKDGPKGKNKSPKNRRSKKSPASRKGLTDNGEPKQRKKPGPKPGSKNKPRSLTGMIKIYLQITRVTKFQESILFQNDTSNIVSGYCLKNTRRLFFYPPKNLIKFSPLGGVMGDVPEGSLTGLGSADLADLDEEQLEQMMMEDEEYGRRQLELAAIEIAKNKKKEEREAKKLEKARQKALEILAAEQQRDPNAPEGPDGEAPKKKKRGRRSKAEILAEQMRRDSMGAGTVPMPGPMDPNIPLTVNPVLGTAMPPEVMIQEMERPSPVEGHLPLITGPDGQLFNPDGSLVKPKRRGRGKGKKTLAMEAARAAEAAAKAAEAAGIVLDPELKDDIPNVLPTPGSSTSGSAPSTPPAGAVSSQGLPVTQSNPPGPQSVYSQLPPSQQSSVITRMLQSQPVSNAPQSFTAAAAAMGQKYFGVPNTTGPMMPNPRSSYDMSPRGRIPSPFNTRQPGQPPMPPHFAAVRSGNPPPIMRMRVPGPAQLYHTPHHPMDPSPSGGGPISISSRDRASPLGGGPMIPAAGSPLAKGGPTPPPYVRGPPISRFSDAQLAPRHQLPPFTSASPGNHALQQPSPPPNRPPGNFSPYHPQPPPNYHYGAYPPPAPMVTTADDAAYQGSPYSAEHFSTSSENPATQSPAIQPPPAAQTSQPPAPPTSHSSEPPHALPHPGSGEFGGLVSYFSSQREDDLDS